MPSKSKAKGNRFEYEIVDILNENGLEAKRAYASNGLSLGFTEDVDILVKDFYGIKDFKIQAKRRAALPKYLGLGNCDAVIVREDREVPLVLIPMMTLIGVLSK
jgi:Holliday junction resolvase|tara:strand:- start:1290 stop:1601 length:312 start_codon:yes stop_codon:yes gene_type:complete